jgi:4-diphosphocytidyl-2-C-methyl-D-erythritol kinase
MTVSSFAPAKVNLFLHVTGKRPDGYHLLDSLAVFPAVGDAVSFEPDEALTLSIGGRFGASLAAEPDNLVLRAARMLAAKAGMPAAGRLHLEKNLPVASGIGGGSADAAAALRLLASIWRVAPPLHELALALGADVPACLGSAPVRMGGVGEILVPAPRLPTFGILLVNPGVPVATADVFRGRRGGFSPAANLPEAWPDAAAMAADLARVTNDLEAAAIALAPVIGTVLATLRAIPGVLLARMSGSGATCFALFEAPAAAQAAAAQAAAASRDPAWWCWGGGLYEPGPGDL